MALAGYVVSVVLGAVFLAAGCIIPAALCVAAAIVLAYRFELRWAIDHTPLTPHRPRPIPKSRR